MVCAELNPLCHALPYDSAALCIVCVSPAAPAEAADGSDAAEQPQPSDVPALAAAIRSHPSTDGEIKELCRDLQVWLRLYGYW